jgi:hypothetical protein
MALFPQAVIVGAGEATPGDKRVRFDERQAEE